VASGIQRSPDGAFFVSALCKYWVSSFVLAKPVPRRIRGAHSSDGIKYLTCKQQESAAALSRSPRSRMACAQSAAAATTSATAIGCGSNPARPDQAARESHRRYPIRGHHVESGCVSGAQGPRARPVGEQRQRAHRMQPPYDPAMGTYQLRTLLCRISKAGAAGGVSARTPATTASRGPFDLTGSPVRSADARSICSVERFAQEAIAPLRARCGRGDPPGMRDEDDRYASAACIQDALHSTPLSPGICTSVIRQTGHRHSRISRNPPPTQGDGPIAERPDQPRSPRARRVVVR